MPELLVTYIFYRTQLGSSDLVYRLVHSMLVNARAVFDDMVDAVESGEEKPDEGMTKACRL